MMTRKHGLVAGIALATALLAACGAEKKAEEAKLDTLEAKVSYIFGTNMANQFKQEDIALDAGALALAVKDVQAGKESRIKPEEIKAVMEEFQKAAQAKQEEKYKAIAETNKKESDAFLAANKTKEGVQTTESGLQYKVVTEGEGAVPTTSDTVKVHYRGTLVNGTEFDSSYARGEPVTFPVNGVIAGWTEALQLMKTGSKYELYIPSDLAYGPGGTGAIGPNQALIFEVELLDIVKPEAAEQQATK